MEAFADRVVNRESLAKFESRRPYDGNTLATVQRTDAGWRHFDLHEVG
ncbi:hypothetical protein [Novipirellula sp.]